MQDRGQDPWIASKLEQLLAEASFDEIEKDVRVFNFGK